MKAPGIVAALAALFIAAPAFAGPDFITPEVNKRYAASDAHNEAQPTDDVAFAYDSAALSPTALDQLTEVATWLQGHPRFRLVLEGHADARGPRPYNADLAARRLETVRRHLETVGVEPERIITAIYGENRARHPAERVDRRVRMFASRQSVHELVSAELARDAVQATWTQRGNKYVESRGIAPIAMR
jgi:outer membrane protein OmpA-like peptidoglycan-associated protein